MAHRILVYQYMQLDPKFLRNQRFAKKFNKKNENKSKKVRLPHMSSSRRLALNGFTNPPNVYDCIPANAGRISADQYWRSRM